MNALRNTIWNKRLPSILGLFFLVFAFGTITWLSRNAILFGTKAAVDDTPKNVVISNISDTSFTVSYVTDTNTVGTVTFGPTAKPTQIAFDDRDKAQGAAQPHTVHYITIQGLLPATDYFFTITSGSKTYTNKSAPYEALTGPDLAKTSTSKVLLSGKVNLDDGSVPPEAIATITSNKSQILSVLVGSDGTYSINLANLRTKDLLSVLTLDPKTILSLQLMANTVQSHVSLLTSQANPVPLVTLSKDYDFTVSDQPLTSSPVASASGTPAAFPNVEDQNGSSPQITTPTSNEGFKDQQPLFEGNAVPNKDVEITIQSNQEITTTVSADANGKWQYRPQQPLAPGKHTITIRTVDADGIIRTLSQSFVVYAAGSEFTEPSISPSPANTTTPTSTPTTIPSATPTSKPTSTPVPTKANATTTPTATATPTPTKAIGITISPTKKPVPLPVTGNMTLVPTVLTIGLVVAVGALLFLLTTI